MAKTATLDLPPAECEFCHVEIATSRHRRWQRSPNGRPYCPECGRIPTDHQRDEEASADAE